jgi:Tol biopolymer transport system component
MSVGYQARHLARNVAFSALALLAAPACGVKLTAAPGTDATARSDDAGIDLFDAAPDASTVDAMLGAWSAPQKIAPIATTANEDDASMSPDQLEITFAIQANGNKQLSRVTRATTASPWSTVRSLNIQLANVTDHTPRYSKDGLTLYFGSTRNAGNEDIYMMTRATTTGPWGPPTALPAPINSGSKERWFAPCEDGRYLMVSDRQTANNFDVYEGTIGGAAPVRVAALSTANQETGTFLSANCKHAFYTTTIGAKVGIMETVRNGAGWTTPAPVTDVNTAAANVQDPWLSTDAKLMLFVSDASGSNDLYMITRM